MRGPSGVGYIRILESLIALPKDLAATEFSQDFLNKRLVVLVLERDYSLRGYRAIRNWLTFNLLYTQNI